VAEEIRSQISNIDKEINDIKDRISHLGDERITLKGKLQNLRTERQKLQRLVESGERAQEIIKAEKRLTEIEKQANEEQRRIYNAQQVVTVAVQNLEALNHEAYNLSNEFPEVRHVNFSIPEAIKKFAAFDAVPTSWAK